MDYPKRIKDWTAEHFATELLEEAQSGNQPSPYRFAFVLALESRGQDARTKQFRHYDRIVKWMLANWPELG